MRFPIKTIIILLVAVGLLLAGYFQGYLHGAIGGLHGIFDQEHEQLIKHLRLDDKSKSEGIGVVGQLNITVNEKPFGMQVRIGSTVVENVFPGFPAQKVGVRAGCEIKTIQGKKVTQGTYLATFQKTKMPFQMTLFCPAAALRGHGPLSVERSNFRILVVQKPFGMDVQVDKVPRVINVLPGYPAEAAGVKPGFVLKAVNDAQVNASNWFRVWQKCKVPCTLTFDTESQEGAPSVASRSGTSSVTPLEDESDIGPEYGDFRCLVNAKPFGMHLKPHSSGRPVVHSVVKGLPAKKAGVKKGDILITVAGVRVDSSNWFASFEQAVPPFGIRFRRKGAPREADVEDAPKGTVGKLEIVVNEKPFGMHVKQGTVTVEEVFPEFPAIKAGVRKGCSIVKINGYTVSPGTWLKVFEKQIMPFDMSFYCPPSLKLTSAFKGLESMQKKMSKMSAGVANALKSSAAMKPMSNSIPSLKDKQEQKLRVLMTERPFGMNVQVNVVPRVVEVLPGYPAEKVGVKRGFVLKEVGNKPVEINTWNKEFSKCKLPCPLTFDTNVPLHKDNPFFDGKSPFGKFNPFARPLGKGKGKGKGASEGKDEGKGKVAVSLKALRRAPDFKTVRVLVTEIPFGLQISAPPGGLPTVQKVEKGFEARQRGVKIGDVLVEVAGLPVDSSSWFRKFSQASPPFGLKFRRRIFMPSNSKSDKTALGATLAMQNAFFRNQYRQSWNATLREKAMSIASKLRRGGVAAIRSYFDEEEENNEEETGGGNEKSEQEEEEESEENTGGATGALEQSEDVRLLAAVSE